MAGEIRDLKYRVILGPLNDDEGGGWLAEMPDLPGCRAAGETVEAALSRLDDARESWIMAAQSDGLAIPEPTQWGSDFSGKFTLRLPKTLHRRLACLAEVEGVSLNQLALYLISVGLGEASGGEGRSRGTQMRKTTTVTEVQVQIDDWPPTFSLASYGPPIVERGGLASGQVFTRSN